MRAFRVTASIWLTKPMSNFKRNVMKLLRSLFMLLLLTVLSVSCTKQDLNEDDTLTNDTEVFSTDNEDRPKPPPPGNNGG